MHAKSTVALVLLAGLAGAWYFLGDQLAPKIGIRPAHPEPPPSRAAAALDALTTDDITAVKVTFPSGEPLELSRADGGSSWKMPGNWPPRTAEVRELVETLGTLRARFHPEALGDNPDLARFGLTADQKPVAVSVTFRTTADGKPATRTQELTFGEPPASAGETPFTRPAFVRVVTKDADGKDQTEVLKLGPDVMPVIRRPAESYRRRQLFPDVERVRLAGGGLPFGPGGDAPETVALPGENVESVTVRRPVPGFLNFDLSALGSYTLARVGKLPEPGVLTKGGEAALRQDRLADAWRLASPTADNADPARLRSVLSAVANLWVDEFVSPAPPEERLGLTGSDRSVTVRAKGAEPVTVRFGGVARTGEREESISVPGGPPGSPPRTITNKVPVEYRYARVEGNPQVFVVVADKFADLFTSPEELADSRVARFDPEEVWEVTVADPEGKRPAVALTRKKGDPKATRTEDRDDRWFLDAKPNPLPADAGKVNELLRQLAGLRADAADRRTFPVQPPAAKTTVTITAREARAENEPDSPTRRYTLDFGKPDFARHLLPVYAAGQPRVALADNKLGPDDFDSWVGSLLFPDTLSERLERPPLAYRGRKLFDAGSALRAVSVAGGFALAGEQGVWKLTAPIASDADPEKSAQFAQSLAGLQAAEYLTDTPTADELKTFGLDAPKHTATLAFSDRGVPRTYTLEIGGPRSGKSEVFARLDKGAVFTLPTTATESFTTGALGLLPLKVWGPQSDKVTAVEVTRFGEDAKNGFALTRDGANWKLLAPFAAPVPASNANPVLAAVGTLTAEKYQALAAANPAEFGFDKPLLAVKVTYNEKKGDEPEKPVTQTVVVGGPTPDGLGRFAHLDTPNAPVFVVPATFVSGAQTPPLSLPDRALLSLASGDVAKVRVAAGKPEDAFTLTKDATGKWTVEGATYGVDAERINDLVSGASRPQLARLVAYGDAIKWADYGLDKPDAQITVTTGGEKPETHTISFGNTDPTGARFVRIDDKPAVGVMTDATADRLTRKKFEYADRTLLTFDPTAVASLTRTKGKEELELASNGVGWDVVKPTKQKADAEFVDELAAVLGRLRAERVAAYGKKDEVFKQYGLGTPAAQITVTTDKPEPKTLRVGNPVDAAKPDGERYAAVDSAAPEVIVGVLPAALANKLLSPPVAFRDRSLAKFVDADKAVVERGDRKVTFAKVGGAWKLTEPVAAPAESGELDALVAEFGKLRADTWVAEKGMDLKEYGLDKPEAKWTLSDGDKVVLTLLVGKKAADGRVHVITDKGELVGLLSPKLSEQVLAEYRQRKAWDVDAAQVQEVEAAVGGAKFAFEKLGPQWLDPTKPGDLIDAKAVSDLVGTLGGLRVERYAADKDADLKLFGLEKPEATLSLVAPTGKKTTLEVGAAVGGTDGKQRYARVADPGRTDVFVLSASDTAKLTRDRSAYVVKK